MSQKGYEKYPKEISFYLEEKKNYNYSFSFLENKLSEKAGIKTFKEKKEFIKKNNFDDIKEKVIFRYFHPNFKKKADQLINGDQQKYEFLIFIDSVVSGKKEYYTQEKMKIINNFIYSFFMGKCVKLKLKISFCIFFEKTPRKNPYSTYIQKIYFFDVWKETNAPDKNISKILNDFEQNFIPDNNDLEYDKMITFGEMKNRIFYVSDENFDNKEFYYTFPFELATKNEIFKIVKLFDKVYLQGFDPSIWDLKYPINNVLNQIDEIENFNYDSIFEKDVLEFHPSKAETKLINLNENFILSGRPGTGKTVVILIKVIIIFLQCLYEHSNIIKDKIDYDFINEVLLNKLLNSELEKLKNEEEENEENVINNKINNNNISNVIKNQILESQIKEVNENNENNENENTENTIIKEGLGSEGGTYKIIFTSLSQSLCAFAENSFIRGLKNIPNISEEIYPMNQKIYEKMSSFVSQNKYPLFLNFRKLIFMIDGSLNFQFFDRPNRNKLKKRQDDCDIRYYPDCQYDVMVDLSFMVYRPGNIYFYRREYLNSPLVMTEINEDTFYNNFNTQVKGNKILNNEKSHISTYEVYSNIISIIKGSIKSYLVGSLSLEDYLSVGKKTCPFDTEQRNEIYKIFEQYESWKFNNKYFDFQDVINYLIREVNIELVPENRKIFDLVFIDEVQDFSTNQLYLLFLISRNIKVLAGDTCQTLSKINTFRFADLNNVLYTFNTIKNIKIKESKNIEINLNFRCQANILKFAHLIFEFIKFFFSNTLDKVRMDYSAKVGGGEKPYLIPHEIKVSEEKKNLYKNLIILENKTGFDYFLKGLTENNLFLDEPNSEINISFGVNHCVICRNNKVVKDLNKKYNNKIFCSTVYESKGLEYEIVILYNFFKDSLPFIKEIWSTILKNINITQVENNNLYLIKQNLNFENYPLSIKDQIYSIFNQKFNIQLYTDFKEQFSMYNFCSELKEFYVAITRAKSRLYIYEEDKDILKLFIQKINNFDILTQDVYFQKVDDENENKFKLIINNEDNYKLLNKKIIGCLKFINNSHITKEKLLTTAYDEYNQNNEYNYKKAFYLFQVLNEEIMKNKCLINLKYIEIQKLKGTNTEPIKTQFISINQEIYELINKINYDDNRQLKGEVLMNLDLNNEALDYYKSKNNYKKCGIVYMKLEDYESALQCFIKGKEYSFAVNCLIDYKKYERLYDFLLEYKEEFDLEHIQYFYKITCEKYFKKYKIKIKDNKNKDEFGNFDNNNKKIIERTFNVIFDKEKKDEEKIFFDEKINLYNLITDEKFKIKSPFILTSNPNNNIFDIENIDKNNIYTIQKTNKEIIYLINVFKKLLKFTLVYLQIIITKTETSNNQKSFIIESKEIITNIENKNNLENLTNEELNNIMKNLVIYKQEYITIIIGILKNIEAKEFIYDLYEINIFKIKILEHIIKDLPILKTKLLNYTEKDSISREIINQVVSYSKFLPIKEKDIIPCFRYIFIRCYHFNALIGITNKNDIISLLDISIITKKQKLFEFLIKTLNIDFINGKINNNLYKEKISKFDILYYINIYALMLIKKFFKYFVSSNPNYNKINKVLEKIKIFPQLYEFMNLISKEKDKTIDLHTLFNDVNNIDCDDIINFNIDDLDMKKYITLISIFNKINLIFKLLYDDIISHKISLDLSLTTNIDENSKIFDFIIKNDAKIIDIYNKIKDYNEINNIQKGFKEIYINLSIGENTYIENYIKSKYRPFDFDDNNCYKKREFLKQNNKYLDESLNKKNTILDSYIIIDRLKNFKDIINKKILENLESINKENINPKYLNLLNENSYYKYKIIDFNEIIKDINEFYYEGENSLEPNKMKIYFSQSKIILDRLKNKNIIDNLLNSMISYKDENSYKKEQLLNYILLSNLLGGGIIKMNYDFILFTYKDDIKDIHINNNIDINDYFKKNFSYLEALKILKENYNSNFNQLLVIIWLRKLFNYFFFLYYDNNNKNIHKLYVDKNKSDINLNIFILNKISIKTNDNDNFIDNYLSVLSLFINNIEKNNEKNDWILLEMKMYFTEIFYSLNSFSVEDKNKIKIKLTLNQMKNVPFLLYDNKELLKEVIIINDENIEKNITFIYFNELNIERKEEKNYSNSEDYSDDYDEIEDSLIKKKNNKKNYY